MREERKPGTIRCERSGPWQAELQRFQPKWCSSSPTFGIGVSCTIAPVSASTTARKSGCLDARALVQAGEVEELLRRRLERLGRRGVERVRLHGILQGLAASTEMLCDGVGAARLERSLRDEAVVVRRTSATSEAVRRRAPPGRLLRGIAPAMHAAQSSTLRRVRSLSGRPLTMSAIASRPPGRSTRAASAKTRSFAGRG